MRRRDKPVPVHYLRENAAERSPRRLLVFDSESLWWFDGDQKVHQLRLWCAELIDRRPRKGPAPAVESVWGQTARELAETIDSACRTDGTTWVYAHNLTFDLAVTGLLDQLAILGWVVTEHALAAGTPWVRLARGNYRLAICDSVSLFPTSVEKLGLGLGLAKPRLPDNDSDPELWRARCAADVAIVRAAVLAVLDWWDAEELGCWTTSGAAIGWNAYRHKYPPGGVVIDPSPAARRLERDALASGFRFQWVHGDRMGRPVADLDLQHAHLTIAATLPLPRKRAPLTDAIRNRPELYCSRRTGVLARVRLRTDSPRYPVRLAGEVWYPVGEFWTTLAGPELAEAQRRGELLEVGEGYAYLLDETMQHWGRWMIRLLDEPGFAPNGAVWQLAKGWSRSVPGKWATRTSRLREWWDDPREGTEITVGRDHDSGNRVALIRTGGRLGEYVLDLEADNSFPAVLAWIQSWTRVYLWRLLDQLGGAALLANTDGVLVDLETLRSREMAYWGPVLGNGEPYASLAAALVERYRSVVAPLDLAVKRLSPWARVLSPSHVILQEGQALAGIPRSAVELAPLVYGFDTWPRLVSQLAPDHDGTYRQGSRTVDLSAMAPQAWRYEDGTVRPVELEVDRDGNNAIVAPGTDLVPTAGLSPRERQRKVLRGTLDPVPSYSPGQVPLL